MLLYSNKLSLLFLLSKKREYFCVFARCFLFSQFSPIEIIVFNKNFYTPLNISFSWVQIWKNILPLIIFYKVLWVAKMPNWPCSGLNYARFEEFINSEIVTWIINAWRTISLNKIVPNWIEAIIELNIYINFVRLKMFHFDIVQNL